MPKKIVTCDIKRWASAGGHMSRMIALDTTTPAPAVMPCKALKNTNCAIVWLSAQPSDASVNSAKPVSTTGRRPTLSDSAP